LSTLGITEIAGNVKNVRTLALTAILIALTIIGNGLLRVEVIPGMLRVTFGFLFLSTIAFLFGPVTAFAAGIISNMLAFLIFPTGASFNPLFDLNIGLSGILYAIFLYKRNPKSEYFIIWIVAARVSVNFICNIIINTYLLRLFGFIPSGATGFITMARVFRNIAFLPVEIILMMIFIKFVAVYAQKYNFINPAYIKTIKTGKKRGNAL
jgi:ECF transporter S component (folate family)